MKYTFYTNPNSISYDTYTFKIHNDRIILEIQICGYTTIHYGHFVTKKCLYTTDESRNYSIRKIELKQMVSKLMECFNVIKVNSEDDIIKLKECKELVNDMILSVI